MKAEDRKRIHDALDAIIDNKDVNFTLSLTIAGKDDKMKYVHHARGFSPEERLYIELNSLRAMCSALATPVSLAMIPDLEENMRYLENIAGTVPFYSRRCAHA